MVLLAVEPEEQDLDVLGEVEGASRLRFDLSRAL